MVRSFFLFQVLAFALLSSSPFLLEASERVVVFKSRENSLLRVENYMGRIQMIGWNQDRIRVTATVLDSSGIALSVWPEGLNIEEEVFQKGVRIRPVRGSGLTLEQKLRAEKQTPFRVDLLVEAPAHRPIDLRAALHGISLQGWRDIISMSSQEGSIEIKDVRSTEAIEVVCPRGVAKLEDLTAKSLRVSAGNGKIELKNVRVKSAFLDSSHGGVLVESSSLESLDVISTGGNIDLNRVNGNVRFSSHSGFVKMDHLVGAASGVTRSGKIELRTDRWRQVDLAFFESESGDISLDFPNDFRAQLDINTRSFDVKVSFPSQRLPIPSLFGPEPPGRWLGVIREKGQMVRVRSQGGAVHIF